GQVDGGGGVPGQVDLGAAGGDHGGDDVGDAAAGEVVGFEGAGGDVEAGLHRADAGEDDGADVHVPQAHPDEFKEGDAGVRQEGLDVDFEELADDEEDDQREEAQDDQRDDPDAASGRHIGTPRCGV